ncbi:tryptophan--tRNA ligase, mitochondrial [Orussus abietinus]|uniref:tryptophan--tRNA ligase, mitochondrial n=1 Tax=Orussus abietinus TaxID=222816 RepID=UPI0006253D31|nr:tryptophan--tRNA ligase, mitochondrial [Orussus abietinus]
MLKILKKRNLLFDGFRMMSDCKTLVANSEESSKTYPKRIFSGIQPTGNVHLGNYLGVIRDWVRMQDAKEDVLLSIVDLHAISLPQDPKELRKNIYNLMATLLACGIDHEKTILFQQSGVLAHTGLCWVLGCFTTMPRLAHLPQFKEKSQKVKDVPLGIYIYPVLQAADILLYRATHVPVGQDQVQHLQLAQQLAQVFNTRYGETFPIPHSVINNNNFRIRSLRDPSKKMSKSSNDPKGVLSLIDEPKVIVNKLKKAITDFTSQVTYNPQERPGVANLILLHSALSGKTPDEICYEARDLDTGKYKLVLAAEVVDRLRPIRERIMELTNEPQYLDDVLKKGTERAIEIAEECWLDVKKKIGFNSDNVTSYGNQVRKEANRS